MATHSYWKKVRLPRFPALRRTIRVDVVVVGGGMTGITTAYLLKKEGCKVALVEKGRCASQDTANTTAHLTHVTDLRLSDLVRRFGRDHARAVWNAGTAALDQIQQIVNAEQIECDFQRVPGYLHAAWNSRKSENRALQREARVARDLGFDADYVMETPILGRPGVRYPNQAKFHPRKYLARLAERIPGRGSFLFERSEAKKFERLKDGRMRVTANGQTIRSDWVVIATDVPMTGVSNIVSVALLQSKITSYTSYAIGAWLPKNRAPAALFWDTSEPYYFLRIDSLPRRDYAVFGGMDHKTGQVSDTQKTFLDLEKTLRCILPEARVERRWSGQIVESHDGLPLIGETAERQFVATGFSGNGITYGTLAGLMACDWVMKRKNPWSDLFSPRRKKFHGAWDYLRENLDYPYYMMKDRLARIEGKSLRSLKRAQGRILRIRGKRVAAYRDDQGRVTMLSPVCTHLGCIVHWNNAERSWDCPCHGSRFAPSGEVIAGPAETPLERIRP